MAADPKVKVEITGDAQSLMSALGKAGDGILDFHARATNSAQGLGSTFDGLFTGLQGGFAGIAVAGAAAIGGAILAFGNLAKKGFETAGALQDLSDKTSLSVEFLSAMKVAASDAGVEVEVVGKAFKKFSEGIMGAQSGDKEAVSALQAIGVEVSKLRQMGDEDAFRYVLQSLSKIQAGSAQTAAAVKLFGKAGQDMVAMLAQTGGDLDKFMEKAQAAGMVYSGSTAKQADEVGDAFKRVSMALEHLAVEVIEPALPALKDFAETIQRITGNMNKAKEERAMALVDAQDIVRLGTAAGLAKILYERLSGQRDKQIEQMKTERLVKEMGEELDAKIARNQEIRAQREAREKEEARRRAEEAAKKAREEAEKNAKQLGKEAADRMKEEAEAEKKAAAARVKVAAEEAQTKRNVRLIGIDGEIKDLQRQRELGNISDLDYIKRYYELEQERIEIQKAAVDARLAIEKDDPVAAAKLRGEMDELIAKAKRLKIEMRDAIQDQEMQGNSTAGMMAGLREYVKQGTNVFLEWKQAVTSVISGVQNAFAQGLQGMLSGQMTFAQGMKTIWNGIVGTVIQAVAQLIAKWIVMTIMKKALGIEEAGTDGGRTAAALTTATAETWAAYAGIPFVGAALASAQIIAMYASMGASITAAQGMGASVQATARATGGLVDRPQLTLLGEAGLEVVAPEADFKDWAKGLMGMGANLRANMDYQDRQVYGYQSQSGRYAFQGAAASSSGPWAPLHVDLRGALIMGDSAESDRLIGDRIHKALFDRERRIS